MNNRLKNKIIIVTGGSGLLGVEIINRLKLESAKVINFEIGVKNKSDFSEIGCDITNPESVNDALKLVIKQFGRIDGLVNNAYPRTKDWGKKFEDIPYESWKSNVDWQLNSYFYLSQQVVIYMSSQKEGGAIVNLASVYGVVGPDFSVYDGTEMTMPAAYSAIKGGLINLSRYMASYFGPNQIRVNVVSPGGIFDNQNPIFVNNYESKVPMKRMGNPADIAPSVAFLLSDDALYITGQNLIVDGGWTSI